MAPISHQKPENALKRAEELIAVNQSHAALSLLSDIITSRRNRSTPLGIMEPIMIKFIQLCVLLRKGKLAKEGLHQYKNITQNVAVTTLESVIKVFIDLAEAQVHQAQIKADAINLDTVEDLDATETPESIMLSTVTGEEQKERTDRELITPWVKLLWEAYRIALDTLRNNARLEILYQQIANRAFSFCLKYSRKTEFRRLCDLLRQHLSSASKYSHQAHAIDLNDPDTLQRHLDTRFVQLNSATNLELWHEAFRTIEDIHQLLSTSNKPPKAFMMANYYECLSKTFMVGENYLFHAAAWAKYYETQCQNKNLSDEEHERIASIVLLSALAIPITTNSNISGMEFDENSSKEQRLTLLLRSKVPPTRESLLKEALSKQVYSRVIPELRNLHQILDGQFNPISIHEEISPVIEVLSKNPQFVLYLKPLHHIILTRIVQQLSQLYTIINLEFIVKLTAFPAPYNYNSFQIEKFIISGCRKGEFNIKINHLTRSLTFENDALAVKSCYGQVSKNPLEQLRTHLSLLSRRLETARHIIDPSILTLRKNSKINALSDARDSLEAEKAAASTRRLLIEKKKELRETEMMLKEREEQRIRLLKTQLEQDAEKNRLEEESRKRDQERMAQNRKEVEKAEAQKLAEKLAVELKEKNIKITKEELENLDTNKLLALQIEQLEKEKKELQSKLKIVSKKTDHLERAYRLEEIKLLKKDYENQQKIDKETHDAAIASELKSSKLQFEKNIEMKGRILTMLDDCKSFKERMMKERTEIYLQLKAAADIKLKEAKEQRIKEVKAAREAARLKMIKDEEERKRIEEEKRISDEIALKEKLEKEAALEKKRAEELENREKLDRAAAMQRERERIAEEKIRSSKENVRGGSSWAKPSVTATAAPSSTAWKPRSVGTESVGSVPPPSTGKYVPRKDIPDTSAPSSTGKYVPRKDISATPAPPSTGKYVPRKDISATPASSSTGKYVPKKDVPANMNGAKDNTSSSEAKTGKWVPSFKKSK